MVYRKGELGKGMIDSQWPHQVARQAEKSTGANWDVIRDFCKGLPLFARSLLLSRYDRLQCVLLCPATGCKEVLRPVRWRIY
jgi:hypothetical protein